MMTVLVVKFFCIGFIYSLVRPLILPLLGFLGYKARNRASGDLDFDVVRFHAKHESIVFADGNNGAHDAPGRNHYIAVLQLSEHLRRLLLLPLHGQEQQEVEDTEDKNDGQEAQRRACGHTL